MNCEYIGDCTSTSGNNLPSVKSPRQNITEKSNTPAQNTPKETVIEQNMTLMGPVITAVWEKVKVQLTWYTLFFYKHKAYEDT